METADVYKVGVEFEMDAIEAGPIADLELKYYLNPEKTCYFEFDGNKTLEFVTNPYKWSSETSASDALFKDLLLAEENLQKLYQGTNDELVKATRTKEKIRKKDEKLDSITINSYWPLGIPQITFQIPLHQYENLRNFAKILFKDSETRLKCFDFNMPTISGFGADTKKEDLEIKGLAYLCIVTIKCLRTMGLSRREVGPKSSLPFMSRLPFRSMYLGLAEEQRKKFNDYINTALTFAHIPKDSELFKDYMTSLGWLLSELSKGRTFIVQDLISSITQDNYDYSFERSDEMDIINIGVEKSQREPSKTDLLSPPPFMEETYAMGALKDLDIRKHFVLEFRSARGSIFHHDKINYQRWVLSSSVEEQEESVFYFFHSMVKAFEDLFLRDTDLKKIGPLEIKPLKWVWPLNNRNLLWQRIDTIARRRLCQGEDKSVEIQISKLKTLFRAISEEKFREKFSEIFEDFDDESIEKQIQKMNDSDKGDFCSIATGQLLEYDPYLSMYLSEYKKKNSE